MATVASNVLALYVMFLQDTFPTIAGHMVSASILSAPAALVMSKLILPETGEPITLGRVVDPEYERESNVMEAVISGAMSGVKLIVGIAALLIALLGLVELADLILGGIGGLVNSLFGWNAEWSLKKAAEIIFYPFTLIIGVPPADAGEISRIIGERIVVTEIQSYKDLASLLSAGALQHPRSAVVAAYALCGFAHFASLAIFVGGFSALVPSRMKDLAAVGFRALLAATLATLMTGAVAGAVFSRSSILAGM
jgi:CNT family concentrative nucleoside transporter